MFLPTLTPITALVRARRRFSANTSTPTLFSPKRLMMARASSMRKSRGRALPGVEVVDEHRYLRAIGTPEAPGWLRVSAWDAGAHALGQHAPVDSGRATRALRRRERGRGDEKGREREQERRKPGAVHPLLMSSGERMKGRLTAVTSSFVPPSFR